MASSGSPLYFRSLAYLGSTAITVLSIFAAVLTGLLVVSLLPFIIAEAERQAVRVAIRFLLLLVTFRLCAKAESRLHRPMNGYCSKANERFPAGRLLCSQIHRKKPKSRPMPRRTARARTKIGLANLVYNRQRTVWLTAQAAPA